ncbi:MAG: Fur family transcriptional regulator [Solirubrobacteraceae bacterium]
MALDADPIDSDAERIEAVTARLRGAGLRATAPRVAVLAEVAADGHLTVDQIATGARRRLGAISTQAVYDALGALTGVGLVRRIEPAGSPTRYETRVGDNHHHVVCRSCGAIADVDCAVGDPPCLSPSDAGGFEIDEAEVIFWGTCPLCQTTSIPNEKESAR